jgi:ankyrin repeat protein
MSGHEAVVQFLLDKGAKTDVTDTFYKASMLDFVLQRKHYAVAKMIIVKGNDKADTDLKAVADTGQADLVQAFLEKGKPSQSALDSVYEGALANNKRMSQNC